MASAGASDGGARSGLGANPGTDPDESAAPADGPTGRTEDRMNGSSARPSSGRAAAMNTPVNPRCSTTPTPVGSNSSCGTPVAMPNSAVERPCSVAGASSPTSAPLATVNSPNPMPRSADNSSTGGSSADSASSGAGAPSSASPAPSATRWPYRRSSHGTPSWVATVVSMNTPVVVPAPNAPDPPWATHSGTTESSTE